MMDLQTRRSGTLRDQRRVPLLTAIVVGVSTTALALALVVRIQQEYGTTEEDEIVKLDLEER